MFKCYRIPPNSAELRSTNNESSVDSKPLPKAFNFEQLVVKVCHTGDIGMYNSALNESSITKKLDCPYTSQFVAFYEDSVLNKTYLVLKHAGDKNLT